MPIPPEAQMRIVPDTNIIHKGGYDLRAGTWPLVLAAARLGHVRLCVPEIVVRETVAHYRASLVQAQTLIRRGNSAFRKSGAQAIARDDVDDTEINTLVAAYDKWLRSTIRECGEILPIADVEHSVLVDAVLSERKPFSAGEKGYRDALIWYSTVAAATSGPLTFVTDNSKDYLSNDGTTLAPDLLADLEHADIPTEQVRPITDLVSVISEYLPNNPEALEEFSTFAESSAGKDVIRAAIDHFFDVEQRVRLFAKPGVLPQWLFDQDIEGLHSVLRLTAASARPLEADTFLVTGQIEGLAYVGGIVWAREPFESQLWNSPWEVWDSLGEQQYYVAHPQPQHVALDFSARFRGPSDVQDLHLDQAIFLLDQLAPTPRYARANPPAADAPPLEHARWLELEMSRLERATSREYLWAISDEGFIDELSTALLTLETGIAEHLTQGQSIPLAPDNLGSTLERRAGVRAALRALKILIDRLEVSET